MTNPRNIGNLPVSPQTTQPGRWRAVSDKASHSLLTIPCFVGNSYSWNFGNHRDPQDRAAGTIVAAQACDKAID
jgi:hypothetical protein